MYRKTFVEVNIDSLKENVSNIIKNIIIINIILQWLNQMHMAMDTILLMI